MKKALPHARRDSWRSGQQFLRALTALMPASARFARTPRGLRRLSLCAAFCIVPLVLAFAGVVSAQDTNRKVVSKVAPSYPIIAAHMHLTGAVRVEVVINPDGTVKAARSVGGGPVFEDNAIAAIKKWKFKPADKETTEVIMVRFDQQ